MEWNATARFWLIVICFVVALIPRYAPLYFFRKRRIPKWFNEWMNYVPVSLFTALVVQTLFITPKYTFSVAGKGPTIIATLLVIGIAYWTRSMAISVIAGLVVMFLLSSLM